MPSRLALEPERTIREYTYYRCSRYRTPGHPNLHWTERQIDESLLRFFSTIKIEDADARQWFVEVIKARAKSGHSENKQHREELKRQHEQVEAKLSTLMEMRVNGEINQEEFAAKRGELHDRQSALRLQLEVH